MKDTQQVTPQDALRNALREAEEQERLKREEAAELPRDNHGLVETLIQAASERAKLEVALGQYKSETGTNVPPHSYLESEHDRAWAREEATRDEILRRLGEE